MGFGWVPNERRYYDFQMAVGVWMQNICMYMSVLSFKINAPKHYHQVQSGLGGGKNIVQINSGLPCQAKRFPCLESYSAVCLIHPRPMLSPTGWPPARRSCSRTSPTTGTGSMPAGTTFLCGMPCCVVCDTGGGGGGVRLLFFVRGSGALQNFFIQLGSGLGLS
jgi:hypothetical protein